MRFALLLVGLSLFALPLCAQKNVGVGTTNPQHQLDVTGDINLTGRLLTNGSAPGANKTLQTDALGTMLWADINGYKNHETILNTSPWVVPAGVSEVMVEAWGGGGGGSCAGGGGGGGYIAAIFTVTPGATFDFTIGEGGEGLNCEFTVSNNGTATVVAINGITINANGGRGSYRYATSSYWLGRGGTFSVLPSTYKKFMGSPGEDGTPNDVEYKAVSASVSRTITSAGRGGNGGNTIYTGALGGYIEDNGTSVTRYVTGGIAKVPGGGGHGNSSVSLSYYGGPGARGMVRIHY